MDIDVLREYCLSKKAVKEDFPFDENTLVFRIGDKIFCLTSLDKPLKINLKCDPEKAIILREEHEEISPGFHMNKKHWNTVDLNGMIPEKLIYEMIDDSYNLVLSNMGRNARKKLGFDN